MKRGCVREDGKILWGKNPECAGGLYWVTKEKFQSLLAGERASRKRNDWKHVEIRRIRAKKYAAANRDVVRERNRLWKKRNRRHILEYARAYAAKTANRHTKLWRERNPEKILEWRLRNIDRIRLTRRKSVKRVRASNPSQRIAYNIRGRIRDGLKGAKKSAPTFALVGCSPLELRQHLESLFLDGMSWDNYGQFGWHIDHIKPCASFDLTDPEQQRQCFHYTNCRPLWWRDNVSRRMK